MSIGTGTALAIGLGSSAATGLIGAKKQASAAKSAAKTQQQSADTAARLQYQLAQDALQAQRQQYDATRQLYAPYTQTAPMSLSALNSFVLGGQSGYQQPVPPGGVPPQQPMYFPGAPAYQPVAPGGPMPGVPPPPSLVGGGRGTAPPSGGMPPGGMPPGGMPPRDLAALRQPVPPGVPRRPMVPMNQMYRG